MMSSPNVSRKIFFRDALPVGTEASIKAYRTNRLQSKNNCMKIFSGNVNSLFTVNKIPVAIVEARTGLHTADRKSDVFKNVPLKQYRMLGYRTKQVTILIDAATPTGPQ